MNLGHVLDCLASTETCSVLSDIDELDTWQEDSDSSASLSTSSSSNIEPLPGLEAIFEELLREDGYDSTIIWFIKVFLAQILIAFILVRNIRLCIAHFLILIVMLTLILSSCFFNNLSGKMMSSLSLEYAKETGLLSLECSLFSRKDDYLSKFELFYKRAIVLPPLNWCNNLNT